MDERYPLALAVGTVLAGQYVIDKVLGQGGFGITYQATDQNTNERVAVKEFFPDTMATRQQAMVIPFSGERGASYDYGKDRFLEEAQTLAQFLGNDNIVNIHSYFEENGTAYFVMDFVEGTSFDVYIREHGGKLGWEETTKILVPIMEALGAVHSKGIVHRDVTPDNIYITADGTVKLLDFGAARYSLGDKSRSLDVVLKHGFAPKEQYTRRGKQGPYTDVYALGATFYFALTGKRPPDSVDRIEEDELIPPSALGVNMPHSAEDAILTALSVQPADRFQSMEAFRRALQISQEEVGAAPFAAGAPQQVAGNSAVAGVGMAAGAGVAAMNGAGAVQQQAQMSQPGQIAMQQPMSPQAMQPGTMGTQGIPQSQTIMPSQMVPQSAMIPPQAPGMYGNAMPVQPVKKKSSIGLILGILVAVLLLAGGGFAAYYFLVGGGSDRDDDRDSRAERDRDDDDDDEQETSHHNNNGGNGEDPGNDHPGGGTEPGGVDVPPVEIEKVSYQFTVFGANTGEVLPGAYIFVMDPDTEDTIDTATTDGSGRVNYEGEAGKQYSFIFGADGYMEAAPVNWTIEVPGDSVELSIALVPQISGDDFIVLLEWGGKLDLDLCAYNEESEVATNYWNPSDSGDVGSGVHFGDHGSDMRFEMIYFHDYSYEAWRDIFVFDQNAIAEGSTTSSAWQQNVWVSVYNADGLVGVWKADNSHDEVGWFAYRVGYGSVESEDAYISDPEEYTWVY